MKTIKNILGLLLALVVATTFNSCDNEVIYEPAEKLDSEQVYFPSSNPKAFDIDLEASSLDIALARVNTEGALTVDLEISIQKVGEEEEVDGENENGEAVAAEEAAVLLIPTTVSFEDGEATATLTVTYDPADFEFEDFYDVVISIAGDATSTPYGIHSYEVKIGLPAPWESLGMATYQEDLLTALFGVDNLIYEVEIQEHALQPGLYRLVNPYGEAYENNDEGDWDDSRDWYLEINAEDPECVYMLVQPLGVDWGYGMMHAGSLGGFYKEYRGWTNAEIKARGYAGTLENGVITFPESAMLFGMAEYGGFDLNAGKGLYTGNGDGLSRVALPGYVLADYSLDIAYAGKYMDAKDNVLGVRCQIVEAGEDIEYMRVAVVQGTDVDGAAEAILDETIESVLVKRVDGYFQVDPVLVPFADEPEDGKYIIVAVGFNKDDEDQALAVSQFTYTALAGQEQWTAKFIGLYDYDLLFTGQTENTLYQSDDDPSRWKIDDWGISGSDFIFTFDGETGEIEILEQEIDFEHPNYGTMYVQELSVYAGDPSLPKSYYEDGQFHFAIVYFVDAGTTADWYGIETFTLTAQASVKSSAPAISTDAVKVNNLSTKIQSSISPKQLKRNVSSLQVVR